MNTSTFLVLIINGVILSVSLGKSLEQADSRIAGGNPADPNRYPFLVSLLLRYKKTRVHICGGTLLNNQWILTAGHCVYEYSPRRTRIEAIAGTNNLQNLEPSAQIGKIEKTVLHELYEGGLDANDIAMAKTEDPFILTEFVQPINLPSSSTINKSLKIAGWGVLKNTFFTRIITNQLQEANVTLLPYKDCYRKVEDLKGFFEYNPMTKKSNICTMDRKIGTCNGDSGGPLIQYVPKTNYKEDAKKETDKIKKADVSVKKLNSTEEISDLDNNDELVPEIVGIVSWGIYMCSKGVPSVYTKVYSFLDFIEKNINT